MDLLARPEHFESWETVLLLFLFGGRPSEGAGASIDRRVERFHCDFTLSDGAHSAPPFGRFPFGGYNVHACLPWALFGVPWPYVVVQRSCFFPVRHKCMQVHLLHRAPRSTLGFMELSCAAATSMLHLAFGHLRLRPGTMQAPWALEYCVDPGPPSSREAAFFPSCEDVASTHLLAVLHQVLSMGNLLHCHFSFYMGPFSWLCAPKRGIGGSGPPATTHCAHVRLSLVADHAFSASVSSDTSSFSDSFPCRFESCCETASFFNSQLQGGRGLRDVSVARGHPPLPWGSCGEAVLVDFLQHVMSHSAIFLLPWCRSLFLGLLFVLIRFLCAAWLGKSSWVRPCCSPLAGDPCLSVCLPLGCCTLRTPVLRWVTPRRSRGRPKVHKSPSHPGGYCARCVSSCCLAIMTLLSLPQSLPIMHFGLGLCSVAYAMARAEAPEDPPFASRRPQALDHAALTTQVVSHSPRIPWQDADRGRRAEGTLFVQASDASVRPAPECSSLGVHLYTPNYRTVSMLVQAHSEASLRSIIDTVLDCAPGVPDGVMDRALPLQPQRCEGYLSLIRFPSFIGSVHDGYSAIAIDLTRVNGPYYATVLPRSLPYRELLEYVDPAAADEDPPLWVYIGCGQQPWSPHVRVTLRDGDVVTVARHGIPPPCSVLPETLASPHNWGPADRFSRVEQRERSCVMYANKRYCVAAYQHTGFTLLEHVVSSLRLDLSRIAACTFHTEDLDVQGNHCEWSMAVVDVPVLADTEASRSRQDFFVLCDVRPLGLKPIFVHTHVPKIHVPSLLSNAGIDLPSSRQLGISGGTLKRGYVSFVESCVLLFFVMEAEPFLRDSSSSDDDLDLESAAHSVLSPQPDSAPFGDLGQADALASELVDPTIPDGHSWNAATDTTACRGSAADVAGSIRRPHDLAPASSVEAAPAADASVLAPESSDVGGASPPHAAHSGLGLSDTGSYTGDSIPVPVGSASDALSAVTTEMQQPVEHSAAQTTEPTTLRAFVYVPDVVPEVHSVSAFLPCSVDTALAAIAAARVTEDVVRYPRLVPAYPQPFPDRILAISAPGWLENRPVVLLDCQRINQVIFAKALHPRLSRESLLLAAGQRHDSAWDIYVHGLLRPLLPGQVISLSHGMLVTFVPRGCGAPATSDLAARLLSREGWEPEADVPGIGAYPAQYFWVLTDAWPVLFEVGAWRRALFDQDLARHLQVQVDSLLTKPSHPRVIDAFFEGHLTSGLIVATQRVRRLPCPPSRVRDNRLIIFVDARPVMGGFLWLLMDQVNVPVSVVTHRFMDDCPVGFGVSVSGAEVDSFGDEQFLTLEDGLLLTVDYVEYLPANSPEHSSPPPPPRQDDDADEDSDHTSDADSHPPDPPAESAPRARSRSPRGVPPTPNNTLACLPNASLPWRMAALCGVVMWSTSLLHAVLAENSWSLTPVLRSAMPPWFEPDHGTYFIQVPLWLWQLGLSPVFATRSRLLPLVNGETSPSSSPVASSADLLDEADSDAETAASDDGSEPTLVDVVFTLLAPDYVFEEVVMQLLLPQSVSDAFDVLDTCRSLTNKKLFPTLCMIWPQPDPRWAAALMLPEWIQGEIVCCLDLARVDGRVFAVRAPRVVDSYRLLFLAGLALYAEVDVFVPSRPGPLIAGEETVLTMGDCVSFAPAGGAPEPNVSLREMLSTHLPWMPGPAFPLPTETRYCLVSDQRYCDFALLPDRTFTYRADIASRLGLHFSDPLLTPAANRVSDVAFAGRPCRTVIAVGHTEQRGGSSSAVVCLLDCRPLLQGWFRCTARDGWLDLALLRESFSHFVPGGCALEFDGCRPHWQWKWVEPGDIVRVVLVRAPSDGLGPSDLAGTFPPLLQASAVSDIDPDSPKPNQMSRSSTEVVPFAALFPHGRTLRLSSLCKDGLDVCSSGCRGTGDWSLSARALACLTWVLPGLVVTLCLGPQLLHCCTSAVDAVAERVLLLFVCIGFNVASSIRGPATRRGMLPLLVLIGLSCLPSGVAVQLPCSRHLDRDSAPGEPTVPARRDGDLVVRAIATPCRGRLHSVPPLLGEPPPSPFTEPCGHGRDNTLPADILDLGQLVTLLEVAVREAKCPAFFLAATLVESLVEHFDSAPTLQGFGGGSRSAADEPHRVTLSLNELLQPTPSQSLDSPAALVLNKDTQYFDLEARSCELPCTETLMVDFTRPFPFQALKGPPGGLPGPERFNAWVRQGCVGRSPCPGELVVITTDGSFDPLSGDAGWAVVVSLAADHDFLLPGQFIGCFAGSLHGLREACGPAFGPNNAYLAEVAALFWGACLAAKFPGTWRCVFRADNVSALSGVGGQSKLQTHPLCAAAGAVHASVRILGRVLSYQHVAGHSQDPANELADAMAGVASRHDKGTQPFPLRLGEWLANEGLAIRWLPNSCYMHAQPGALPAVRNGVMSWTRGEATLSVAPAEVLRPFLRVSDGCGPPCVSARSQTLDFRLACFNVLSLLDTSVSSHAAGLHGATGRVKLLCASLHSCGIEVAGLQECRTFKGTSTCQGFKRFASGRDEHACYGVELWVAEKGMLDASAVTVLHTEPTLLLASVPFRGARLCILVAHGPHRVHSEAFRAEWWGKATNLCSAYARDSCWIIMVDGNCRVGSITSLGIGAHQGDPEDDGGEHFRALVEELDCWLPSTFSETAFGDGGTLYQKRNGEMDRSDYVAVPRAWPFAHCVAWVEPSISAGHRCLDHFATAVMCTLRFCDTFQSRARAQRIDGAALANPENFETVDHILASAPVSPWETDASEQVAGIVDHIYRGLAAAFPQKRRRMRGPHFSDTTQGLHQFVCGLRHSVRTRLRALRDTLQRCAFLAWRAQKELHAVYSGRWLWRLRIRHALDCVLLRRFGNQLRASCRVDRAGHLATLAAQIAEAPGADLHRSIRKVMRPKKYRRDGAQPLPMLRTKDGNVCATQAEATQVWREHFRVLEAGLETSPAQLATSCRHRQLGFEGTDTVEAGHLPTWDHLQAAFRHASPHKASGPDLLPPVLCRVFSQRLTEVFWPVMMKAVLRSNEAIGLKGGVLHKIAKPSAVSNTTAGFRGILVQSCLSKALHRAVRHLAVSHWQGQALPMQIGGRQGCPADFGQFCSRAFLAHSRAQNCSAAILFVDISAAYYGVIREAILGAQDSTRPVEDLASSLGLTAEDLQRLQYFIDEEPVLRTQQASEVLCEVANELHRSTWFLLSGDTQLVETFRGTRPGGSLADIIFNILFCKVLGRRDRSSFAPHVPSVPWSGKRSPWSPSVGAQQVCRLTEVSDVVYADDLASFLCCQRAVDLPGALSGAAAETVDTLLPHGLSANIGPTKTAAVVAPAGSGSRTVRGELFGARRGRLPVLPENRGAFLLDLVPAYRHLGSYITCSGNMLNEIRHRLAAGRAALKEGKQRLFACRRIPLQRRVEVFRVHVLSTVLAGVGTWPDLNGQEAQLFAGGVFSMYRQLLCLRVEGGFHCTSTQITARVGLLPPLDLLHVARLRFLGQMVRHGPDPAWALLSHFSAFQQALRNAASWLLRAVGSVCTLGDIETDWDTWESLFSSQARVRTLLKRAETWHLLCIDISAKLETFCRAQWDADPSSHQSPIAECEHACIPCKLAFHTRQQWGAHAHRVHSYHSRAHRVAKGRKCGACGLQVASLGRLRTHLRLSPACVAGVEKAILDGTFSADLTEAHELAPAVPGIGKRALGPATPELLPELSCALDSLLPAAADNDELIFDVVSRHIAPLPVLRRTLSEWSRTLEPGVLKAAADDVLLVLLPEHLCTRLSGKKACSSSVLPDFVPDICPVSIVLPLPALPILVCGPLASSWFEAIRSERSAVVNLDFAAIAQWNWRQAAAACVTFPVPPSGLSPVFSPPSCSLRALRQLSEWIHSFLSALEPLLLLAKLGRPVRIRFPFSSQTLEPLSTWLTAMAGLESIESPPNPCLTLEFNCVCLR